MTAYSAPVRDFGLNGPHIPLVQQVLGPNLAWIYTQFVTKFPDADLGKSEFPWHQDNGYSKVLPENNMTIWIPLDDVDVHNGCVWLVPRSHLNGILPHGRKSADSWHLEVPVDGDGIPAILKAGEAVAFTGLTLHRSKLNHSDKARRAFFMQYVDANGTSGDNNVPIVDKPMVYVVSGEADYFRRSKS
jgi:ectoine hydroxylase-related dioxygenase (phytanoyl-CoA dioxygenase family)